MVQPGAVALGQRCIAKLGIIRRMTFLAIDVGNTRLKWALYDAPRTGAALMAHGAEFLDHIDRLAEGSWASLPHPTRMLGCVVAGDAVKRRVQEQMELWDVAPSWVVSSVQEAGLTNGDCAGDVRNRVAVLVAQGNVCLGSFDSLELVNT